MNNRKNAQHVSNRSNYNTSYHDVQNHRFRRISPNLPLTSLPIPAILFSLLLLHITPNLQPSPSSSQDGMQVTRRTELYISNVSYQTITTRYPSGATARARATNNPITHHLNSSHPMLFVPKAHVVITTPFHPSKVNTG